MTVINPVSTNTLQTWEASAKGGSNRGLPIGDASVVMTVQEATSSTWSTASAVVLTGSMARGEASWHQQNDRLRLSGDAEFLAVFSDRTKLPSASEVSRITSDIESKLCHMSIDAHIGLSPVNESYLRTLRPHIFAYELITHGKIIAGDLNILRLAPQFRPIDIPLEDGFCLLMNRVVELLEALCDLDCLIDRVQYRMVKLWLDLATSFLLFKSAYEPTYEARATRLTAMAADGDDYPIPIRQFADRVAHATRLKLKAPQDGAACFQLNPLVSTVQILWRWYLQCLTAMSCQASDSALCRSWSRSQWMPDWLRGWVSAFRRSAELRNNASAHGLVKIFQGSPRRLIYSVASELFFSIPDLSLRDETCADRRRWLSMHRRLPIARTPHRQTFDWRQLGAAIAHNYHVLLENTRS